LLTLSFRSRFPSRRGPALSFPSLFATSLPLLPPPPFSFPLSPSFPFSLFPCRPVAPSPHSPGPSLRLLFSRSTFSSALFSSLSFPLLFLSLRDRLPLLPSSCSFLLPLPLLFVLLLPLLSVSLLLSLSLSLLAVSLSFLVGLSPSPLSSLLSLTRISSLPNPASHSTSQVKNARLSQVARAGAIRALDLQERKSGGGATNPPRPHTNSRPQVPRVRKLQAVQEVQKTEKP